MADEIDRAQYLEELAREQAIERARMNREAPPEWIEGVPYCNQCGCDYPEARAKLGYGRCVECADATLRD